APPEVTIDGFLDEWDLSGRISSFADYGIRDTYSVDTALMWDDEFLYVSFQFKDKTPAYNLMDPEIDSAVCWKSDSFALRTITDRTFWVTGWYYTPKEQNGIIIDIRSRPDEPLDGPEIDLFYSEPGGTDLGGDIEMATRVVEGGYIQELRIPWNQLYDQVPEIVAGVEFQMGLEFLWGDLTGKTWPEHRYADNLQPDTNDRLFFWTATKAWGQVLLLDQGDVPVRQYRPENSDLNGPVSIHLEIPEAAERVTVVVDDEEGKRVRNLIADVDPAELATAVEDGVYAIELRWDGRDELGEPVPAGEYQVRGLWHEGLAAFFDTSFYNPGTPPWETIDGSGGWGADHHAASVIARAGEGMSLGFRFAEGGAGTIGLGADGLKKWGEKRGAVALAADPNYTYIIGTLQFKLGNLCRFNNRDGSYAPFERQEGLPDFDVPLESIIPGFVNSSESGAIQGEVLDMVVSQGRLYFVLDDHRLVALDSDSLAL
ncbi:MAG: FlgD immunoglobulin-like domain containing protein, partial [Puniceicoccales bacterium]